MIKKIDRYIIKTYMNTFLVSLALIIAIVIVFDLSEKMDDFLGKHGKVPTLNEIVFDYYFNFIPYFAGLYAPLFVFISVIFFTSRMASRMELISVLVSGVSYARLLRPFVASALIVTTLLFVLVNFIIPYANADRVLFEKKYFGQRYFEPRNIHRQFKPGYLVYIEFWSPSSHFGQKFSIDEISDGGIRRKMMAQTVTYDSINNKWTLNEVLIRNIYPQNEKIKYESKIDTAFGFGPSFFADRNRDTETMNYFELNKFIEEELQTGSTAVNSYLVEKHQRTATPFSTVILTLIAVPLAGRKVRGGIGLHIGLGICFGFTYIFFDKISITYALSGSIPPMLAVWLPNLIFLGVGLFLLKKAQK